MPGLGKGLWYIDENPKYCDFCDNKKKCATIATDKNVVINICESCLEEFKDAFNEKCK